MLKSTAMIGTTWIFPYWTKFERFEKILPSIGPIRRAYPRCMYYGVDIGFYILAIFMLGSWGS